MSTLWSTWLSAPRARSAQRQPKALAESSVPTIRSRRQLFGARIWLLVGRPVGLPPARVRRAAQVDRRRPEFRRSQGSAQRRPEKRHHPQPQGHGARSAQSRPRRNQHFLARQTVQSKFSSQVQPTLEYFVLFFFSIRFIDRLRCFTWKSALSSTSARRNCVVSFNGMSCLAGRHSLVYKKKRQFSMEISFVSLKDAANVDDVCYIFLEIPWRCSSLKSNDIPLF